VSTPQINLREIINVVRRRKYHIIFPFSLTVIICVLAVFMLPRLYESSIRILVQRTEVANPLTTLANAMSEGVDDPLKTFDEIIFSQKTIGQLIDSLGLGKNIQTEAERRSLFVSVYNHIQIKVQLRESFTITFSSDNPVLAQRGATVLASIFIQTITAAKSQKYQATVDFYQSKLDEYQKNLDQSQRQMISDLRGRARTTPDGNMYLYTRLDQQEQRIRELEGRNREDEQNLNITNDLPQQISTTAGRQSLFELQRSQVPYANDLRTLLANYEEILSKYTPKHPEATKAANQIIDVLERISVALRAEINKQKSQLLELRSDRSRLVDQILNSSITQEQERDKESNYSIYQRLFNEMKVKLEEAQISLALSRSDESRYTIIDPALVPLYPSKPSRVLIMGGGIIIGLVIGVIAVIIAEILDTTIRTPREIIVLRKPIIGFLPDAKEKYLSGSK
jgi:uncharacterized protein involved in exopolysaccharide biosynthesis